MLDLDAAVVDRSLRPPMWEPLLGCHGNQLACLLIQDCVVAGERKQLADELQARRQGRRMSQLLSLGDRRTALRQCPIGEAETEEHYP